MSARRREDRPSYPSGWARLSREIRFGRAAARCECGGECGLHRAHPGPRRCTEIDGHWAAWARGRVVLTVAHLCACSPPCADPAHLKAMCQRCHLRVDADLHRRHRAEHRRQALERAGQLALDVGEFVGTVGYPALPGGGAR